MPLRSLRALFAAIVLAFVLAMAGPATADVFVPASSRVAAPGVEPGLQGFFYDRAAPPGVLNSLALANATTATSRPTGTVAASGLC